MTGRYKVVLYFDKPTQARLVCRPAERLEPEGYLLVGRSESPRKRGA